MARPKATLELSEGERMELQALARRRKSAQAEVPIEFRLPAGRSYAAMDC